MAEPGNDRDAEELIDQAFAPSGGMPPFPGLDLFNPDDRAFWYGNGTGYQLVDGVVVEVTNIAHVGKLDYEGVVRETFRALPPGSAADLASLRRTAQQLRADRDLSGAMQLEEIIREREAETDG